MTLTSHLTRLQAQDGQAAARALAADPSSLTVEHGERYGPCESALENPGSGSGGQGSLPKQVGKCRTRVRYRGPCGHLRPDVACGDAFRWAVDLPLSAPPCEAICSARSPLCGHEVRTERVR